MTSNATPRFRADHVGSFLLQPGLLAARAQFRKGEIGRGQLRAAEGDAIRETVRFRGVSENKEGLKE